MKRLLGIGSRIKDSELGLGVVINMKPASYKVIFVNYGEEDIALDAEFEIVEYIEPESDLVSLYEVESTLKKMLEKWMGATEVVQIGDRWKGGKIVFMPGRDDVSSKEMPIDVFFHKIVMVRDKLRVLEQKVNSSTLDDEAKVDIQQYISRCYGTMTSFNILFKEKNDHFSSKG